VVTSVSEKGTASVIKKFETGQAGTSKVPRNKRVKESNTEIQDKYIYDVISESFTVTHVYEKGMW
jgi:hypothetical protein